MRTIFMSESCQRDHFLSMTFSGQKLPLINGFVADVNEEDIKNIEAKGYLAFRDEKNVHIPTPIQEVYAAEQWPSTECNPEYKQPMRQMVDSGVEKLIKKGFIGSGVHIGVADTGVDASHPDIISRMVGFRDFVERDNTNPKDPHGHGTAVVGVAAGSGAIISKFHGVAPGAKYSHARVLDVNGSGYTSDIIEGLQWLSSCGCQIINLSLGSMSPQWTPVSTAVQNLCKQGILVIVAAGNDGPCVQIEAPANADDCVTVVGCNAAGEYCEFSCIGPAINENEEENSDKPDIMAWGRNIVAPLSSQAVSKGFDISGSYRVMNGTSFACPFISGCAALYIEAVGDIKNFKKHIKETAFDSQEYIYFQEGCGRVNIYSAIAVGLGVEEIPPKDNIDNSQDDCVPDPIIEDTSKNKGCFGLVWPFWSLFFAVNSFFS